MILTPNIVIDNDHMNAFQEEFEKFNSVKDNQTVHWGNGDLETCDIVVKQIRTPQGNGMYVAVSNGNEGILICRLISAPIPQGCLPWGRKVYVMDSIRVHPNYIGRGVAPAIYRWLSENGYTIISDSHQNANSMAIWRKLAKSGNVYVYNMEDNTWRTYNPVNVEDWMLFGNNDLKRNWNIRLMLPSR